ncbi:MAG: ATP-binding protein [Candidatus Nitrosoabyssus spongiisocia]|nr:MAG: ATP-binding protein [Nitrosopumilaceae archaeon AB1(1)]
MTKPVHVGRALQSLRDSDFNTVSAIGEVIDNAIQAEAKNIKIKIKKNLVRKNKYDMTEIAFADDGVGMDIDTLGKCMQLGFSARYNQRDGIGRFGVGMTLGAITQCTRIEVYSKPKGGGWNFTYLDLDEMKDYDDAEIPPPTPVEVPREYADLVADHGTLVIWKNWDREDAAIDEMIVWIGRTYRKFIGQQIIKDSKVIDNPNQRYIFLDDGDETREISALNPLYVTRTQYNEETSNPESEIVLLEIPHKFDPIPTKSTEQKKITIRMSLLPESWRKERGTGNSTDNRKRHVPHNEGISILRNDREVFYGHLPYYQITDKTSSHYKGFIDMDRFWGCEIAFDADLDHWFSIKNIKVGARPITELRKKIQDAINPTIYDFRDEIRRVWKSHKDDVRKKTGGTMSGTKPSEETLKKNSSDHTPTSTEIDTLIRESGVKKEAEQKILLEKLSQNPVTFYKSFEMDPRSNFIDVVTRGSTSLIKMNMKHPFFEKLFDLTEKLSKDESYTKEQLESLGQDIESTMELFIASFVLAHKQMDMEKSQITGDVIDKLIYDWTYYLHKNINSTLEK